MLVLGLDASLTGTGYCWLVSEKVRDIGTISTKLTGVDRLAHIRKEVGAVLEGARSCGLNLVCLEGYSFGSKGRAVFQTGELGGVIRCLMHDIGIEWVEVAPSTLKKYACGKGNVKKDQVMLQVYKRWGLEAENNNEADAYVLARIGLELLAPSDNLIKPQQEVIEKLRGSMIKLKGGL